MRETRMTPFGTNVFAIRVDSYENGEMKGEFTGASQAVPAKFNSLTNLIIMIDELLDAEEESGVMMVSPFDPSFDPAIELEVLFRQNHSWQGRVKWLEGGREATFRSVLELLIIMETIFGK